MKMRFATFGLSYPGWLALLCLSAITLVFIDCAGLEREKAITSTEAESDFETIVKPLFEHRCVWCHNDREPKAGLNLQSRELVYTSNSRFVIAGKPGQSLLYTAIGRHPQDLKAMPADGWKISAEQARAIHNWIAGGAPWPEGRDGKIRKKDYRVDLDDYL